jgi:carbonic anhydrase
MKTTEKILLENKTWVLEKLSLDKAYFERLSGIHAPSVLWMQSSDILLPVQEIINTEPGEIIVYSNIANQIHDDDLSLLAVLEDAIHRLEVEIIVICGYSHCEGIRDILVGVDDRPIVKKWLSNLQQLYEDHKDELLDLSFYDRENRLQELNIKAQVERLSHLPIIQKTWEKKNLPLLFGWYFDLNTGMLKEIFTMDRQQSLKQLSTIV